jgi:hypothetical protein
LAGGFGHGKKIYFSALRLFVALNWLANILLFYRSNAAGARF